MPRSAKTSSRQTGNHAETEKCRFCQSTFDRRGLKLHERFCSRNPTNLPPPIDIEPPPPQKRRRVNTWSSEDLDISQQADELHMASDDSSGHDNSIAPPDPQYGPYLPDTYIKVLPHPHAENKIAQIISLCGEEVFASITPSKNSSSNLSVAHKPFAPFRTRPDFEFAQTVVQSLMPKPLIDMQLRGINGSWSNTPTNITFQDSAGLEESMTAARRFVLQFRKGQTRPIMYKGKEHVFDFEYRDPWEYILSLVSDPTLSDVVAYHSEKKYVCTSNGYTETSHERLIDEPNTARTWWRYDTELPCDDQYPHCYMPLHVWLDKGMVSSHVKKHPMVVRAAFVPSNIRNASGNGGGMLFTYFPIIDDPDDPSSRSQTENEELRQFRREVYQEIARVIFETLRERSWHGEAHLCSDSLIRILHPGILILSLDGEEAAAFCGCYGAKGNFPCNKCLVEKLQQHYITTSFEPRTPESMELAVMKAENAKSKTARMAVLKQYSLYPIKHSLWHFRFSDPYAAASYDTLHSDESGKWAHHLYALILLVLDERGAKGAYTQALAAFPRWSNLKHFNHVTTMNVSDGQSWLDVLECILPCITEHLPRNSSLVHCTRSLQMYRMLLSLGCMSESRIRLLYSVIQDYEKCCSAVEKEYGKSFDFPKQHAVSHVITDIKDKGTCKNFSTRPGEGFQQEAAQAWAQTNKKNAEHQMVREDERQEAISRIRMAVDSFDAEQASKNEEDDDDSEPASASTRTNAHWSFGSRIPGRREDSRYLHELYSGDRDFTGFDAKLRAFLIDIFPEENITYESTLEIELYQSAKIHYQSCEDWTAARDIVRCHPNFHQRARYDNILVHMDSPGLTCARLRSLIRVTLPSKRKIDLAFVHMQRCWDSKKWSPRTVWKGCRMYEELKDTSFILMDYVIRGFLLAPIFPQSRYNIHVLIDCVDGDMFLRSLEA